MRIVLIVIVSFIFRMGYGQMNADQKPNHQLFVLGLIDNIHSVILNEDRTLNIYLPEGYNAEDTVHYSVVYLLDGGADEDFIHVTGLYQFNNFEWINGAPKSIIVGIVNTNRKRDLTFPTTVAQQKKDYPETGGSEAFINFFEKELQPYIEKTYKTNSSRTIIGQSLGGLLATEILFKEPALFDTYIIISPSLWWDNGSLLNMQPEIVNKAYQRQTKIYIGVGKEGLTPSEPARVMEVDANLLAEKLMNSESEAVQVYFDYLPQENHATIEHQAIFNALRLLYAGKK